MNAHQHLNEDVFIDGLYGLADVEELAGTCPQCVSRWIELREKRAAITVPVTVAPQVMAAQRRNVFARIENPPRPNWAGPTVAAAAAACVLVFGILLHHPLEPVKAPAPAVAMQQLPEEYSEAYSMEQSFEPSASASLSVLFEADGSLAENPGQSTKQ